MSDERRRKSWRELDRARESGGGGRRRDPDERNRERAYRSGAYGAYKAKLDQMFTPGGAALPPELAEKLGPPSEGATAKREALQALRDDPSDARFAAALEAEAELPDDPRFLMSLFDGLKGEAHLRVVLERLLDIVESGRKPNRMLLLQRLTSLEHRVEEDATVDLVTDLRGALE